MKSVSSSRSVGGYWRVWIGGDDILHIDAVDEVSRVRDQVHREVVNGCRETVHDCHALRLRVGFGASNGSRMLNGLLELGTLWVIHGHVFEHGVEHEGITRYALPWFCDELAQTKLVPRVRRCRVFDTLEPIRTSSVVIQGPVCSPRCNQRTESSS